MGDPKTMTRVARPACAALLAGLLLAAMGCTTLTVKLRKPGVRHAAFAHEVEQDYACENRTLPFFTIETNELLPDRVKPGAELNHRFVYVLCPSVPTEVIEGTLVTRILHRAQAVTTDEISLDLEEGRWVIDTFITLPEEAPAGAYALDLRFSSKKGDLNDTVPFVIER